MAPSTVQCIKHVFECNYNDIPEDGRHAQLHSPRHAREPENTNALFCLTALAGTLL